MGPNFPAAIARSWLAFTLADTGDFEEGIIHGQEAIRLAEGFGQPFTLIHSYWGLGYLYSIKGDLGHAVTLLERALGRCREWNLTFMSPFVTWCLGSVYALSGRLAEGLSLLREGLTAFESIGFDVFHALVDVHLGEVCVLASRLEDARAVADRALTLARERGQRGFEALALRLHGEIASRLTPPDVEKAEERYRQARALALELGMRPLVAHCHLGLGKLSQRMGKEQEAQEHLTTAAALFRDMDLRVSLEQAEAR